MATLRLTKLVLDDKWPGPVNPNLGIPTGGWDNSKDNFSTADATGRAQNAGDAVPLGQKRMAYTDNSNCRGSYTMMYLCLHSFEDGMDVSQDFSDGHFFHAPNLTSNADLSQTEWSDTSRGPYFVVSRCTTGNDFTTAGGPVAIPCSTKTYSDGTVNATNGYGDGYGWFWVGGVCPCKDVTIMDDSGFFTGVDLTVDSLVRKGPVFLCQTGAAAWLMSCDPSNVMDDTAGAALNPSAAALRIGWVCDSAA